MDKVKENKILRGFANEIADQVYKSLLRKHYKRRRSTAPKCDRITRSRGHAGLLSHRFSVPRWSADHIDVFIAYVCHEAIHCCLGFDDGEERFWAAEIGALALFGLTPVYIADHWYPVAFLRDNAFVCDMWGRTLKANLADTRRHSKRVPVGRLRKLGVKGLE